MTGEASIPAHGDAPPPTTQPGPLDAPPAAPVAAPPAQPGLLSQIPPVIFGLPLVAWIGIAIFLPIFFLIFSAYL